MIQHSIFRWALSSPVPFRNRWRVTNKVKCEHLLRLFISKLTCPIFKRFWNHNLIHFSLKLPCHIVICIYTQLISFFKGIPERWDVDGCEERIWGTKWVQMPPLTKGKGIWLPSFPVYPGLRECSRFPSDKFLLASATGKIFCMPQKTKMFAFPPIQG